jgi:futalosine hydrolase
MSRRILIVTAVQAEADAIGRPTGTLVVASGIGRTNAAAATTAAILSEGPFTWVLNAGVAGSLPKSNLSLGEIVVASECVYAEEGIQTPDGFQNMQEMGFSLGNFEGNEVPVDDWMLKRLSNIGTVAPIATVATCSGSDVQAKLVQERTGCLCEAMEGAAVVHAAKRVGAPAIEIRVISNTTGDRENQEWDFELALNVLNKAVDASIHALWSE